MFRKDEIDYIMRVKTTMLIELIMKEKKVDRQQDMKLWYNSKTKHELWDKDEYKFVSVTRCLDELEKELTNDPFWLIGSFE